MIVCCCVGFGGRRAGIPLVCRWLPTGGPATGSRRLCFWRHLGPGPPTQWNSRRLESHHVSSRNCQSAFVSERHRASTIVRDAPDAEASRSANVAKAEIAAEQTLSFRSVIRETMMTNPKDLLTSLENALNDNAALICQWCMSSLACWTCGARIRSVDQADCALSKRPPVQQGQNSRQGLSQLAHEQPWLLRDSPPP